MPRTSPWHTIKKTAVYHNNTNCTKGNNIEKENRRPGTGGKGKRLCSECISRNKRGE
jgi:hypothetical protein